MLTRTPLGLTSLATICTLSGIISGLLDRRDARAWDAAELRQEVGAIRGKCCQPGRRWGCDPANFGQTGCVLINKVALKCAAMDWVTMDCTAARCNTSHPEHVCAVDILMVAQNRCMPTGFATTVGCPADKWQCKIDIQPYTLPSNPRVERLVCDQLRSTICPFDYSECR